MAFILPVKPRRGDKPFPVYMFNHKVGGPEVRAIWLKRYGVAARSARDVDQACMRDPKVVVTVRSSGDENAIVRSCDGHSGGRLNPTG
jgi:hypothetical protein